MKIFSKLTLCFVTSTILFGFIPLVNARSSTIGYWRFEEGSPNTIASGSGIILDSSGSMNPGTPSGSPIYRSDVPVSIIPQTGASNSLSMEFDSTDDKIFFAPPFVFNQSGDATLEFWLKYPGGSHQGIFWGRSDSSDTNRFHIYVNPDNTIGVDYRDPSGALHPIVGGGSPCCGVSVLPNTWTHIALTRTGNTYSLYTNGVLMSTQKDASPSLPTSTGWTLSGRSGYEFTGSVDEVRISNVALVPGQFLNATALQTIFSDDFESYTLGTFPSSGGWQLLYNGAGSLSQYVDNTHSVSGSQSLHLVGSSCWSSTSYHPVSLADHVVLEGDVYINQIVSCGCTHFLASIGFRNPTIGTWGTPFGYVGFSCDGNIYALKSGYDSGKDVLLMPYVAGKWYHVKLIANFTARTFDVYIDGVLKQSGLQILDSGMPTGIEVEANHGNNPTVWFDDVTCLGGLATPPKVTTGAATSVAKTSARLSGTVNPEGLTTTAWFEGSSTSGSYTKKSKKKTNLNGTADLTGGFTVYGLKAGTTYYYRLCATNSAGTSYGSELSFTTLSK